MLGRSVTFGPKSVEKRPQQENFFELTTPITQRFLVSWRELCKNGSSLFEPFPAPWSMVNEM